MIDFVLKIRAKKAFGFDSNYHAGPIPRKL